MPKRNQIQILKSLSEWLDTHVAAVSGIDIHTDSYNRLCDPDDLADVMYVLNVERLKAGRFFQSGLSRGILTWPLGHLQLPYELSINHKSHAGTLTFDAKFGGVREVISVRGTREGDHFISISTVCTVMSAHLP